MATLKANGTELVRIHAKRSSLDFEDEIWISVGDRGWALRRGRIHVHEGGGKWTQGNRPWKRLRRIRMQHLKQDVEAMLRGLTRADWDILSVEWKGLP